MRNTENSREGLMNKSKKFMEEFKKYKKHSYFLKKIQGEFEKNGFQFKTMSDIENILLILNDNEQNEDFLDDTGDYNDIHRHPNNSKNYNEP